MHHASNCYRDPEVQKFSPTGTSKKTINQQALCQLPNLRSSHGGKYHGRRGDDAIMKSAQRRVQANGMVRWVLLPRLLEWEVEESQEVKPKYIKDEK
jgi:hypothetical protein